MIPKLFFINEILPPVKPTPYELYDCSNKWKCKISILNGASNSRHNSSHREQRVYLSLPKALFFVENITITVDN